MGSVSAKSHLSDYLQLQVIGTYTINRIVAVQREKLEEEIAGLKEEAERVAEEARELAGEVPF